MPDLLTDLFDLVLGRACRHCGEPGRALCGDCLAPLRRLRVRLPPTAALPGGWAAAPYDGQVRRLVIDYKEEGNRALGPMLAVLLADAVDAAMRDLRITQASLVRVPGHRRPARGFDALGGIVRGAVRSLQRRGLHVASAPALAIGHGYPVLKAQTRAARASAIAGALTATPAAARIRGPVIVVDDVMTTGATIGEAVRALSAASVRVDGIAVVAARR